MKKQKGTGGARCGSILSPLFPGGGRVFGPVPRSYRFKLNKKLKQLARKSALSEKAAENVITVVEDFTFEAPRTKAMIEVMKNLKVDGKKLLIVLAQSNLVIEKSARNLQNVKVVNAADLNTYDVLNCTNVIMAEGALNVINEMFSIA